MVKFFVPGIPAPKGSFKTFRSKTTGRLVTMNDNKTTTPWQNDIKLFASQHMTTMLDEPVEVEATYFFLRPKKPKYALPAKAPDVDKLARNVLDALTGVAFDNDAKVTDIVMRKRWAEGTNQPGVLITIKPATKETVCYHQQPLEIFELAPVDASRLF